MLLHKVSLKPKPESRTIRIETSSGSYVTTTLKARPVIILIFNRGKTTTWEKQSIRSSSEEDLEISDSHKHLSKFDNDTPLYSLSGLFLFYFIASKSFEFAEPT